MGLGKCKELDEWLMGSGESAETADSKNKPSLQFGARHHQNQLIQPGKIANIEEDCEDIESAKDDEDWMFQTFDKAKLLGKPKANKEALDPFGDIRDQSKDLNKEFEDFSKEVSWGMKIGPSSQLRDLMSCMEDVL